MAFQNFSFPQIIRDLDLALADADLFSLVVPIPVRPEFLAQIIDGVDLAGAINTEKARSEFVIAPALFELRRLYRGRFALFSGVEMDADASRGLTGVCDFVIARSPSQLVLSTPLIIVVEAKNDNTRNGFGQCIAAMVAAQMLNQAAESPVSSVYGVSTTGSAWRFLRLRGRDITFDPVEYHIERLDKILGILWHIVEEA